MSSLFSVLTVEKKPETMLELVLELDRAEAGDGISTAVRRILKYGQPTTADYELFQSLGLVPDGGAGISRREAWVRINQQGHALLTYSDSSSYEKMWNAVRTAFQTHYQIGWISPSNWESMPLTKGWG